MKTSILFIVTQGEMGGAQKYVFDLAAHLDKNRFEVEVFQGAEKQDLKNRLQKSGIQTGIIKHLRRNINPLRDIAAVFEIATLIKSRAPDIVHLNSSKAGFLGSIAARLAGFENVVFTAHGFAFLEPNSWLVKKIYFWAEKIASSFRKKIISVSETDRQAALRYRIANPKQIVTIHNGISPSTLSGRSGSNLLPEPVEGRIIGTIANLYPTKGINYLIDAAKIVTTDFPIAKFVVIGEGAERPNLESRIKHYGLKDQFLLLGEKENASQYLADFDIFALPSVKEGLPYTILEAAAAGRPIVATSVGGIPEMVTSLSFPPRQGGIEGGSKPSGILVEPKNPRALAQAIIFLLTNPDLAKTLGRQARERVKEFSLQKMVRATEKMYSELIIDY